MNVAEIMSHQAVMETFDPGRYVIPADRIRAEVAFRHGLTVAQLVADTRAHRISHPRQEAMYELLARTTLSSPQVARKLGLTDHSTVLYGADKHAERNGLPYIRDIRAARAEAEKAAA